LPLPSKTYTPKNSKILVETSVLLAASVRVAFPEEGEVTDQFYHPSIQLFSLIKKNMTQRLGIVTQTVEREAFQALSGAVAATVEKKVANKSKHFEYKSIAWNKCEENLRKLANCLLREPCDETMLIESGLNHEVYEFYKGLERRALSEAMIVDMAYRQRGASSNRMKQLVFEAQIERLKKENAQLVRLKSHHASPTDIKILAEAIHIKRHYNERGQEPIFLLASTDSNNFVPANSEFGISRPITEEIFKRYGIECDWPSEIFKKF
jgi:hypothetical protein